MTRRDQAWVWGPAGAAFLLAVALHLVAQMHYPYPQNDEVRFLLPAEAFARTGAPQPPLLNASDGIWWMPHGYYAVLAPFLALGGATLRTARWASFVAQLPMFAAFALMASTVASRQRRTLLLVVACAWLLAPVTISSGNFARMESFVIGLVGVAAWLAWRQQRLAATTALAAAALVHPAALAPLLVAGLLTLSASGWWRDAPLAAKLAAGCVLILVVAQAAYLLGSLEAVREDVAFQFDDDRLRQVRVLRGGTLGALSLDPATLLAGGLSIAAVVGAVVSGLRSASAYLCAIVVGFGGYIALGGHEWPYATYVYGLMPALLAVAVIVSSDGRSDPIATHTDPVR